MGYRSDYHTLCSSNGSEGPGKGGGCRGSVMIMETDSLAFGQSFISCNEKGVVTLMPADLLFRCQKEVCITTHFFYIVHLGNAILG